jgi:hypothetical protein
MSKKISYWILEYQARSEAETIREKLVTLGHSHADIQYTLTIP